MYLTKKASLFIFGFMMLLYPAEVLAAGCTVGCAITTVHGTSNQIISTPSNSNTVTLSVAPNPNFPGIVTVGNLLDSGLAANSTVCTDNTGQLVTTGCVSGGVASITPGPSGNLTFTPSTGAVVGDITESPQFAGLTTIGSSGYGASPTTGVLAFGNTGGLTEFSSPASGCDISAINAYAICIQYNGNPEFSMDNNGRLGTKDIFDASLTPGKCLEAGGAGEITSTAFACSSGGAISSVIAGTSGNVTVSPTTGNVVVDISESPNFTGVVTASSVNLSSSEGVGCLYTNNTVGTIQGSGGSCISATTSTFVIPSVGSTVTVPLAAGEAIYKEYTPLTISDGTNSISGNTSTTTNSSSTSISFVVERINDGISGNTMANAALITTGGYDAGASTGITAGNDIVVTTPNPSAPTVSVIASPVFSGVLTAGNAISMPNGNCINQFLPGGGSTSSWCPGYANIINAGGIGNNVNISNESFYVVAGANGGGLIYSNSMQDTGLTSGDCVQASTGGLLTTTTFACPNIISYVNGGSINGFLHRESFNNVLITNGSNHPFSFGTSYITYPTCSVTQSAAATAIGGLWISAMSSSSVTVTNNTGVSQIPNVNCSGY